MTDITYKSISTEECRKIINDRLEKDITNSYLCAKMGYNSNEYIQVYKSYIKRALNKEPFYALIPKNSMRLRRESQVIWEHDLSSFQIFKVDKVILENIFPNITEDKIDASGNHNEMVSIPLSSAIVVYDSKLGLQESEVENIKHMNVQTFSLLEIACLYLKLPESGTKWLDDLILKENNINKKV